MKGGVLDVLLVNATGLHHSHLMESSGIYVLLKCGGQIHRGKASSGKDGKVCWNERFSFSFATREWNSLTRLRIKIMKIHTFNEDSPIGETTIHLGGVLAEGSRRGYIDLNPAPYNVVLPDGTYEGEIRIDLKFTSGIEVQPTAKRIEEPAAGDRRPHAIYRALFRLAFARLSWPRMQFFWRRGNSKEEHVNRSSNPPQIYC